MRDFRRMQVWQKGHQLTLAVYRASGAYPRTETYGLMSQTRRAASSIPANIAEGCGRDSGKELARFLRIVMGSASELEYHLLLARDLDYLTPGAYNPLAEVVIEVKRMLTGFIHRLESPPPNADTDR